MLSSLTGRPKFWQDVPNAPAFVINLDSHPERMAASVRELQLAGFTDVRRFQAVDAQYSEALKEAWSGRGSPAFAAWVTKFPEFAGKQGCFLSHLSLWNESAEFEDDILLHRHWSQLAPM